MFACAKFGEGCHDYHFLGHVIIGRGEDFKHNKINVLCNLFLYFRFAIQFFTHQQISKLQGYDVHMSRNVKIFKFQCISCTSDTNLDDNFATNRERKSLRVN